ncbi:hypothetical protein K504DRAFT_451511 [Pleomassaria siparia CBS 279.74]|uniref:Uncharacterized protein n=1 Tax=Pleomassaria siparia CBS 279.74 TaxID=1314801 RepID=A0A6G1JSR8_9PLEO|nr:hypothetical protein K504DRAFT_451511 [Pleomassaria siparia CBS 279.74]
MSDSLTRPEFLKFLERNHSRRFNKDPKQSFWMIYYRYNHKDGYVQNIGITTIETIAVQCHNDRDYKVRGWTMSAPHIMEFIRHNASLCWDGETLDCGPFEFFGPVGGRYGMTANLHQELATSRPKFLDTVFSLKSLDKEEATGVIPDKGKAKSTSALGSIPELTEEGFADEGEETDYNDDDIFLRPASYSNLLVASFVFFNRANVSLEIEMPILRPSRAV